LETEKNSETFPWEITDCRMIAIAVKNDIEKQQGGSYLPPPPE